MADPLTELDQILALRKKKQTELVEGTKQAMAQVDYELRPAVRSWMTRVLRTAEIRTTRKSDPLLAYFAFLPSDWRGKTEVLFTLRDDPPRLLPMMRGTPDPLVETLEPLDGEPSNNAWTDWLSQYEERVGLSLRPPYSRKLRRDQRIIAGVATGVAGLSALIWVYRR